MKQKLLYTLLALLGLINLKAQETLIFGTSFEIDSSKYCSHSTFINPLPYDSVTLQKFYPSIFSALNTSDIYSPCDSFVDDMGFTVPYKNGIPNNLCGYEFPHYGNNYIGLVTYESNDNIPPPEYREWIGIRLPYKLKLNNYYKVGMFLSLADYYIFSTPPPQLYFSADSIFYDSYIEGYVDLSFINYNNVIDLDTNIFSNSNGWTYFSALYNAKGNEKYLYIGNFYSYANTHFLANYNNEIPTAYYFIDDLSIYELDSVLLVPETPAPAIAIYPNPATGSVSISLPANYPNPQLYIYNLTGQLVATKPVLPNQPVPITELSAGMYIFSIQSNNTLIDRQRVVVY